MPFQPGQSGNPSGRPKENAIIRGLAQAKGTEALNKIVSLLNNEDPKVALAAAKEILDRAYGKAAQSVDISDETGTITAAILQVMRKDAA